MNKQKGFSNLIMILIIVGSIVIIGGGIFGYKYLTKQTVNENTDEIVNRETYVNQIHKFQIEYPKEWMLQKEVGYPPATIISYRWENGSYCSFNMLIIPDNTDNSSEMDWYRQNGYKEEKYTINGMPAVKFSKFPVENSGPVGVIYFNNNSDRIDMVVSPDKYQNCMNIFNQMISTFKFIK